jgi:hypothetical protein
MEWANGGKVRGSCFLDEDRRVLVLRGMWKILVLSLFQEARKAWSIFISKWHTDQPDQISKR